MRPVGVASTFRICGLSASVSSGQLYTVSREKGAQRLVSCLETRFGDPIASDWRSNSLARAGVLDWPGRDSRERLPPFPSSLCVEPSPLHGLPSRALLPYTKAQLVGVLNTPDQGNAVIILAHQLIAALINQAASAKDNTAADAAIATSQTLLTGLNLLTSNVPAASALGQQLVAQSVILDGYNNGDFHTCTDGKGLVLN